MLLCLIYKNIYGIPVEWLSLAAMIMLEFLRPDLDDILVSIVVCWIYGMSDRYGISTPFR